MSGSWTEEKAIFFLRVDIGIVLVGLTVGFIYATGIGQNHRTAGFIVIALAVRNLYSCWVMARIRQRLRAEERCRGELER